MGIVQNLTQGFSPSRRAVLAGGGAGGLRGTNTHGRNLVFETEDQACRS
jgi:hypothetical protein